ncbi:MAG TPA: hypothetical protein VG096_06160 [Bryobacteraceae bacterium]|nr:hypothetical protein [Bryobacteraceae bacterium]
MAFTEPDFWRNYRGSRANDSADAKILQCNLAADELPEDDPSDEALRLRQQQHLDALNEAARRNHGQCGANWRDVDRVMGLRMPDPQEHAEETRLRGEREMRTPSADELKRFRRTHGMDCASDAQVRDYFYLQRACDAARGVNSEGS